MAKAYIRKIISWLARKTLTLNYLLIDFQQNVLGDTSLPPRNVKKDANNRCFFQKPSYLWCSLFSHQAMLFAFKGKSQGVVMSLYQKRNLSSVATSVQRWRQSHFWGVTSCWHYMGGNTKKHGTRKRVSFWLCWNLGSIKSDVSMLPYPSFPRFPC